MTDKDEALAEAREIERCAAEFGIPVSASVRDALVAYGRLLLLWGGRINLTAAKSGIELVRTHLPDTFAIARCLADGPPDQRIVDVGSGGGLPALPLALLLPTSAFVLVEATGKKVAFLRTAVRALSLGDRVEVEHARVAHPSPLDESFDVAMSRAALPPRDWLTLGACLVRPGGRVLCLSSQSVSDWPDKLELREETRYRPDRWITQLSRST